jgi:CheY-like chemotaxis protein
LREALVNLIFNAVDALPEGGVIRLRAYRQGRKIAVEVQDTGTGMSVDVQSRIFQPRFTTKGPHGTGLGLVQVQSTVEQHGGEITIDSTPGQGTTICLLFPAAHAGLSSMGHAGHVGSLAILVVDDEPAQADLIARMLRLDGHTVVVTHSGAVALERLSMEVFDLVISDLGMPDMDGWEFTKQARAHHPTVSVIIVSGWGSQISPEDVHERGVQAVVAKPYRLADLRSAIATLDAARPLQP